MIFFHEQLCKKIFQTEVQGGGGYHQAAGRLRHAGAGVGRGAGQAGPGSRRPVQVQVYILEIFLSSKIHFLLLLLPDTTVRIAEEFIGSKSARTSTSPSTRGRWGPIGGRPSTPGSTRLMGSRAPACQTTNSITKRDITASWCGPRLAGLVVAPSHTG